MRMILTLIRNQPVRYGFSVVLWITIWTMPIVIGLIVAAFFDQLTGETAGWNLTTIIAVLWAYLIARIVIVFGGMRLHSETLFRAGASMRGSMLAWIFSLPGARPIDETPGEVVSRFRDDVDHTVEAMDFTVDFIGSMLSALVAVILLFSIDPVITMVVFAPVAIIILVVSRTGSTIRRYRTAARESTEAIMSPSGTNTVTPLRKRWSSALPTRSPGTSVMRLRFPGCTLKSLPFPHGRRSASAIGLTGQSLYIRRRSQ